MEQWAREAIDALDLHVAVLTGDGTIVATNAGWDDFARRHGGGHRTGIGQNYFEVCRATDDPWAHRALTNFEGLLSGLLTSFAFEYPCHGPDAAAYYEFGARLTQADPRHIVVWHRLTTAERKVRDQLRLRSDVLDEIDAIVVATDLTFGVEVWNSGAERLTGYAARDMLGRSAVDMIMGPDASAADTEAFCAQVLREGGWEGEVSFRRRDGSPQEVHVRFSPVWDDDDQPLGFAIVAVDLASRLAAERELARHAQRLAAITASIGDGLCILDATGHVVEANPAALDLLGASAERVIGGSFLNRMTGHAPVSVTTDEDLDVAVQLAGRPIGTDFEGPLPDEPTEDHLIRPDGQLLPVEYFATRLHEDDGDGWVVIFRDIADRVARRQAVLAEVERSRWIDRINEALDKDQLVLFAQPIVRASTGEIVQHELLLRMRELDGTLIPPSAFLPVAEEAGLAPMIDRWVIDQAFTFAAAGHAVEINLSATSLGDPALAAYVAERLDDIAVDPALIVFELTETAVLRDDLGARRFAMRVRARGCRIALDDFGTGYGGFTYLKHLPVDILKIDVDFVRDAATDASSRHVITAVVDLARSFALETVAEGVEDPEDVPLMVGLGVDMVQGFGVGRPTDATHVFSRVARQ